MTRHRALVAALVFVFGLTPFLTYAFYESTRETILVLRTPPASTMIGRTIQTLAPHFNKQMDHHPLYFAFFSKTDDLVTFLEEVGGFYVTFRSVLADSFIGPHVTIVQSAFNVPSAAYGDVFGDGYRTTLIKLDNNLTDADQDRVLSWMNAFANNYARAHVNFTKASEVYVTGVGAMTAALRDTTWMELLIVAAVAIAVGACVAGIAPMLDTWISAQGIITASSMLIMASVRARLRRREPTFACPRYAFTLKRIAIGTTLLVFFGTLCTCLIALSTLWLTVRATDISSLAPILGFLLLCPLSLLFFAVTTDTSIHVVIRRRTEAESLALCASDGDRRGTGAAAAGQRSAADPDDGALGGEPASALRASGIGRGGLSSPAASPSSGSSGRMDLAAATGTGGAASAPVSPTDARDDDLDSHGYLFNFEQTQTPTPYEEDLAVYQEARNIIAPWLVVAYVAALLLCGALWLVHVESVSSAGCGCFFALVVHATIHFGATPYALALLFPSESLVERAIPLFANAATDGSQAASASSPIRPPPDALDVPFISQLDNASLMSAVAWRPMTSAAAAACRELTRAQRFAVWLLAPRVLVTPTLAQVLAVASPTSKSNDSNSFAVFPDDSADNNPSNRRRCSPRCLFASGLAARFSFFLTIAALILAACISAEGNVAFFREVPRNAEAVVQGHRLLNAVGAATSGPYYLAFKTRVVNGVLADPNAMPAANWATFEACRVLGFNTSKITSITHVSIFGDAMNVTAYDAAIFLALGSTLAQSYVYLWDISVDATGSYFQTMLYPDFDPYDQSGPVRVQEQFDGLVDSFRAKYSDTFEFIGWYGANAPTWAAMVTAMPRSCRFTAIALILIAAFNAVVWFRWGSLDAPSARVQQVTYGDEQQARHRDPLAQPASDATRCTRLTSWRIARSIVLCSGHSLAIISLALTSAFSGFAMAVWMFQCGHTWRWIWPILADVEGISWLVVPILIPATISTAVALETVEWFNADNEQRRAYAAATTVMRAATAAATGGHHHHGHRTLNGYAAANGRLQSSSSSYGRPSHYQPSHLHNSPCGAGAFGGDRALFDDLRRRSIGDEDILEDFLSPRAPLTVRFVIAAWVVGLATLAFSETIMINEVGVILGVSALAQILLIGPIVRPMLALALDVLRRVF